MQPFDPDQSRPGHIVEFMIAVQIHKSGEPWHEREILGEADTWLGQQDARHARIARAHPRKV
ncbi:MULTISPECIES: hypothetical protein [Sphingobium]|uniref:hypothetical protein n=1 Tax=Sphingobium TaxID=165695 RepID=UPI001FD07CA6|nr:MULTISPECIES: hypothetical protein [Sphingobium]